MRRHLALLSGIAATCGFLGCAPAPPPPVPPAPGPTATASPVDGAAEVSPEAPEPEMPTETAQTTDVSDGSPGGYESPEAAFAAMTEAIGNKDYVVAVNCLTDESQQTMATGLMLIGGLMAAFGGEEAAPLLAALKQHGIEMGAEEPRMPEDLAPFVADVIAAMEEMGETPEEGPAQWANAELTELMVDGDTATGTVVIPTDDGEKSEPAEFRNTDSGWLVHLGDDLFGEGTGGPMIGGGPSSGDDSPSEPLAEAVLEDGLTSTIDLTREQPFVQEFSGQDFADGTLFVTLNLIGDVIIGTYEYGEFQLVAAEDSTGAALELAAPVKNGFDEEFGEEFIELNDFFLDKKDTLPIRFALTPPADGAEQIASLELSIKLKVREDGDERVQAVAIEFENLNLQR